MSHDSTPGVPGQVTDPSTATPAQNDVAELLRLMELNVRSITRMSAVLVKLSDRSDLIERRLTAIEGDGNTDKVSTEEEAPESSERRSIGHTGRLALRHDGVVMLEVTSDVAGVDLLDREVAQYVTLTEAERSDAIERADVGLSDAAARAAWQLGRARKGYPSHA